MDEWSDWVIAFALILCFLARLSWGLMYAGFILVVATLMSLIVKSAQVVVLTGFMVVFLLFLLYGLSLVSWWVLPAPLPSLQSCVTNCVSAFSVLCSICTRHYPCSIQLKMMRHTFQILYGSAFSPYSTHPRESANKKKMVWVFPPIVLEISVQGWLTLLLWPVSGQHIMLAVHGQDVRKRKRLGFHNSL